MLNTKLILRGNNKVAGNLIERLVPFFVELVMSSLVPIEI